MPPRLLGRGWDSIVWLFSGGWAFRFPSVRRKTPSSSRVALLAALAGAHHWRPVPERVERAGEGPEPRWPWTFAGYRVLVGVTGCDLTLSPRQRGASAPALGEALGCLHRLPPDLAGPEGPPADGIGRADQGTRLPRLLSLLAALQHDGALSSTQADRLAGSLKTLGAAPAWTGGARWCHGDLYPRHLIYRRGRLAGIIDWGDVHAGDPACDLSLAWTLLPAAARPDFFAAWGVPAPEDLARARFRALHYGLNLLRYGLATADAPLLALARRSLESAA